MSTTRLFPCLFLIGFAVSVIRCGNGSSKPDSSKSDSLTQTIKEAQAVSNPFAKSVYFFAPKLDKVTCEVYGDCECCWDNIIFIDDIRFVRIYYCDADRRFRNGTYVVQNDSVFLVYNSLQVSKALNWDWYSDTVKDKSLPTGFMYLTDTLTELGDTLASIDCIGNKRLKTGAGTVFFGQPDTIRPFREFLLELQQDSIPQRLKFSI